MSKALERYVESIMRERNRAAREKVSKDVGEICRAEDQRTVIPIERVITDDNLADGYDYL